ncbi:MAG: hypothetical protein GY679_00065 [Mycoplasma sp.]|nr:hypothetical protein [Mycoplasma sp.]
MELSQEFIQENGFNEDQVTAINGEVINHVADLKKGWDGLANANAEKIIDGALTKTVELTGIARNEGEKSADYLKRANELFFESTKSTLETEKQKLDKLIKDGKPSEQQQAQYDELKGKFDKLQQKEAMFTDYEENDYKGKYEKSKETLTKLNRKVAFNSVKPNFPDTVNSFEAKARWKEFQKNTEEKYNVILDEDNEAWVVDKENEHKTSKLSDLVSRDEILTELVKGREQKGIGSKDKKITLEGLPFEIKENATPLERTAAIKEYLATKYNSNIDAGYAKDFTKFNQIALGLGKKLAESKN